MIQPSSSFMSQAILMALDAEKGGDIPIGGVLVHDGQIIAQAGNQVYQGCDPTAHAEIVLLRAGAQKFQTPYLVGCDLYVTLEPCAMCAQAIAWARIRRVYFGAYDPKGGGVLHGAKVFEHSTCHHKPEVIGGLMEEACGNLLKDYFKNKRD